MARRLPADVLHESSATPPLISACEHIAGRERFMQKALSIQENADLAFDVTLDLEDGAPTGREAEHAKLVADLLAAARNERNGRIGVRVHDIRSPHCVSDLETVVDAAAGRVAYFVVPKIRHRGDVEYFASLLQELASDRGRESTWPIHILIESRWALHDVETIAAHPDVETLDFDSMDFISDHAGAIPSACMRSPGQFEHALMRDAKTKIVSAALLHGKVPVHNVTLDVRDVALVASDARRARTEFGFLRMWSVHPDQIEPIVRAMSPTHEEVHHAATVLTTAQDADWGPVRIEDELYDRASYRYEWTLLRRAHVAGYPLDRDVRTRLGLS